MKKHHSYITAVAALVLAIGGGVFVANFRTADATVKTPHFARPAQKIGRAHV